MSDQDEKTTEQSGDTSDSKSRTNTLLESEPEPETTEASDGTHQGRRSSGGYVPT